MTNPTMTAMEEIEAMEALWGKAEWSVGSHPRALKIAREALEESERLRERLEITHAYQLIDGEMVKVVAPEGMPDGIECRDETIKLLEARAEATEARAAKLERALKNVKRANNGPWQGRRTAIWEIVRTALSQARRRDDVGQDV